MTLEILSHQPPGLARGTPLLFVHGGFVGAWCWDEYFLPWFASQGYAAHAVSLRGHGCSPASGPLDLAGIDDYVADVLIAAGRIERPPVLVGHSMGAIVIQRAARRCGARGMVLMGPVPPHGLGSSIISLAALDPPLFLALNAMQLGGASNAPALRKMRDLLFSASLTEPDVRRHLQRLQGESQRALLDLMWPQHLWISASRGLPTLVIGTDSDALCPVASTREAASFHGVSPKIFEGMAHLMMLEPGWRDVADHTLAWLGEQGLDRVE